MTFDRLNHYGYSKDIYRSCRNLITETNIHHARILNLWFSLLCIIVLIISKIGYFVVLSGNSVVYFTYLIVAMSWNIFVFLKKDFSLLQGRIVVIFDIIMILTFSLYSSAMQPYMCGVMYPVMMVVDAISFMDTFFAMSSALVAGSIVFVLTSYYFKPLTLAYVDGYNAIIFLILSFLLQYSFQHMRLSRFVTYYENINIQRNLEVRSSFDTLTSLLNRGRFFSMANEIIRSPHDDYIVLCLFDLDGFKQINDQLGHQMGDKAIQIAGETLLKGFGIDYGEKWSFERRAVKEQLSFAGRLGGDEFVVFLRGKKNREEVRKEAEKILEALAAVRAGELKGLRSSVGIAEISPADTDIDEAYSKADEALYGSKAAGKHTITFSDRI